MKASVIQGAIEAALRNQPEGAAADPDILYLEPSVERDVVLTLATIPPNRMLTTDVDQLHSLGWKWHEKYDAWLFLGAA